MISTQNQGIHCKVSFNGELRRFLFNGTEFGSLYQQIQGTMGLVNKEFVLKYKDDEGDMITLSTSEELKFAISCLVPTSTLRLDVTVNEPYRTPTPSTPVENPNGECQRRRKWDDRGEKREMKWEQRKEKCMEKRKERLDAKRQRIVEGIERLSNVPSNQGNPEWRQRRLQTLQQKLNWIDSNKSGNLDEEIRPRHDKKQKYDKTPMTPEKKALIEEAKSKIRSQKEIVYQLHSEIRNRKSQWPEIPADKKDEVARAIMELKQQKKAAKQVLWELKKGVWQIRNS